MLEAYIRNDDNCYFKGHAKGHQREREEKAKAVDQKKKAEEQATYQNHQERRSKLVSCSELIATKRQMTKLRQTLQQAARPAARTSFST